MKKQDIEDIELGFSQLTFVFKNNKLKEQDRILYYIKNLAETDGHVVLDEFIQYVKKPSELSEFPNLQNIFCLAQELKIHFRINKQSLHPYNVRL